MEAAAAAGGERRSPRGQPGCATVLVPGLGGREGQQGLRVMLPAAVCSHVCTGSWLPLSGHGSYPTSGSGLMLTLVSLPVPPALGGASLAWMLGWGRWQSDAQAGWTPVSIAPPGCFSGFLEGKASLLCPGNRRGGLGARPSWGWSWSWVWAWSPPGRLPASGLEDVGEASVLPLGPGAHVQV